MNSIIEIALGLCCLGRQFHPEETECKIHGATSNFRNQNVWTCIVLPDFVLQCCDGKNVQKNLVQPN